MRTTAKAVCPFCGNTSDIPVYSGINVAEEPELKPKVKDGSLFLWECPHCGKTNLAAGQTIYHDPEERVMIWLLPPGSVPEEKVKVVGASLVEASETLEGYIFRRVEDVGSLIEKVNIIDAGLDDMAVEMCKYVTKMELAGKDGGKSVMDAPFKFFRIDGPDNELTFTYPSGGAMQGVQVGFNVYEDCAGILGRNPQIREAAKGLVSIDQAWLSKYFQ